PPRQFMVGSIGAFLGAFAVTAAHSIRSQKKHKKGLWKLQNQHIKSMCFMDMDSLAPPMAADASTEEGEKAAKELLQQHA
ncbi:hypothetical protein, conserved, partial [Eimeria tenella]